MDILKIRICDMDKISGIITLKDLPTQDRVLGKMIITMCINCNGEINNGY